MVSDQYNGCQRSLGELENASFALRIPLRIVRRLGAMERNVGESLRQSERFAAMAVRHSRGTLIAMIVMLATIGFVSAYDSYLTVRYHESLYELESNPMARWIMQLDGGPMECSAPLATFLGLKIAGTVVVLLIVPLLYLYKARWGLSVAAVLCGFQLALAAYLSFATPSYY